MMENIKAKATKFATNPKFVKAFNKVTNAVAGGCAVVTATAMTAFNASAFDLGANFTAAAAVDEISGGASPFLEPAITIMCAVSGLKLGMKFLRGSAR